MVYRAENRYIYLIGEKNLAFRSPIYFFNLPGFTTQQGTGRLDMEYGSTYFMILQGLLWRNFNTVFITI
jgi:hypothetical protein